MQDIIKRETIALLFVVTGCVIVFSLAVNFMPRKGDVIVINCGLSEISPDFTTEMREACRQARIQSIQKDIQRPK
jgi:hypothetical protein